MTGVVPESLKPAPTRKRASICARTAKLCLEPMPSPKVFRKRIFARSWIGIFWITQRCHLRFCPRSVMRQSHRIAQELGKLQYPLYFLGYETYSHALPPFD